MINKSKKMLYSGPLTSRACRVRLVDVAGSDAMVERVDGTVIIVDVNDLNSPSEKKNFASRKQGTKNDKRI